MSILHPAGPGAETITQIWWVMFWAGIAITLAMIALALCAALRKPGDGGPARSRLFVLGGGIVFPASVLIALLGYGLRSGEALLPLPSERQVFRVEVVGHQWWWEVRYPDRAGGPLYAANEIHIPVGRPVDVHVSTGDVIHSFWVPRLGGKIDAIPGQTNVIRLEAAQPGVFRGQCAEFCGAQHARMAFHVEAHDEERLDQRLEALESAAGAEDEEGPAASAFDAHCGGCHSRDASVRGDAPNLADLALRRHIGAGTLENTPANLRRWLVEHQEIKPGNRMPPHDGLASDTLDAIADLLGARP